VIIAALLWPSSILSLLFTKGQRGRQYLYAYIDKRCVSVMGHGGRQDPLAQIINIGQERHQEPLGQVITVCQGTFSPGGQ
jgi:hypothetical protein